MQKLTLGKGDYGYNLNFTVTDADGDAYSIDGYTVTLKVWQEGVPGTLLLDEECTEDVAASGTCHYTVQDEDFDTVGRYSAELELTTETAKESTEAFAITIIESG